MVATLIRIPEEEHELYKEYAYKNRISLAEFFRRAARRFIKIKSKKT